MARQSVSDQLRTRILSCPLSYNEIARETDLDPAQVWRFVKKGTGITDTAFSKLCKYFGLELRPIETETNKKGK